MHEGWSEDDVIIPDVEEANPVSTNGSNGSVYAAMHAARTAGTMNKVALGAAASGPPTQLTVETDEDEEVLYIQSPEVASTRPLTGNAAAQATPSTLDSFYRRAVSVFGGGGAPPPSPAPGARNPNESDDDGVLVLEDDTLGSVRGGSASLEQTNESPLDTASREVAFVTGAHVVCSLAWLMMYYFWPLFFTEIFLGLGAVAILLRFRLLVLAHAGMLVLDLCLMCLCEFLDLILSSDANNFFSFVLVCTSIMIQIFIIYKTVIYANLLPRRSWSDLNEVFAEKLGSIVQRYSGQDRAGVIV